MKILLTQSFGKESEYRRAILAILSVFCYWEKPKEELQIVLFTDQPKFFNDWFKGLKVHYVSLTQNKIEKMRGEINFLHRMKITLIEETFRLFPQNDIFYIDSDTFFTASPLSIFNEINADTSFMHLKEYEFSFLKDLPLPAGETFQAFYRLIEQKEFKLSSLTKKLKITSHHSSWNAGVMCFHHTHYRFIEDVYKLTDYFYPNTQNHASEQYAFSIILQTNTQLLACENTVYHYWYRVKKEIIDHLLFQNSFKTLEKKSLNKKITSLKRLLKKLPKKLENNYLILLDNSIQSFNKNKFREGYLWYLKALAKQPLASLKILKDVLYHTKRLLINR